MLKNVFYKPTKQTLIITLFVSVLLLAPVLAFAQASTITRGLEQVLWTIVNTVFGFFVGVGGAILNGAVTTFVVGFGEVYRTTGLGFSIDSLWSTVRDIFNLTFIFGLVFIGFKMIFNTSDSNARRMLVSLVLAALLVNFSLFITKFIIDFSNIAATQFAQAFNSGSAYRVSDGFMQLFGINSGLGTLPEGAGFTYIFGMLFLYLVAAFVFAAGGVLLIIRFVVLNIYMVLSPLMFLGFVFPGLNGISRTYWQGFLGRAFFAPAYILMLYFSHQILVNMQGVATAGSANLSQVFSGSNQYVAASTIIPFFIIIAGFLVASLVVAQKMGAEGASSAIAIGKRLRGYTQRAVGAGTAGAAAVALQRSVGYGAQRYAESDKAKQRAGTSRLGAGMLKASRAIANTSFDARQVGDVGKTLGIGTGTKGGYQSRIDTQKKADADFAKSLGETKVEKGEDGKYTDAQVEKRVKDKIAALESDPTSKLYKEKSQLQAANAAKANAEAALAAADKNNLTPEGLAKLEADIKEAEKDIKTNTLSLRKAENEALASAEASVTYEKQLAFIKRRENEASFLTSRLPNYGSAGGAMTGAGIATMGAGAGVLATGASVIGAGTIAAPIAYSFGAQNNESVGNLRKIYGKDGSAAIKDKRKRENITILADIVKDENGGDTKKDDKKDGE